MDTQTTGASASEQHPTAREEQIVFGADIELLHALATAPTLAAAASSVGVSPRHARRLTSKLLNRMGVTNVRSAVAVAATRGLIDEPPSAFWAQDQYPSHKASVQQRVPARRNRRSAPIPGRRTDRSGRHEGY